MVTKISEITDIVLEMASQFAGRTITVDEAVEHFMKKKLKGQLIHNAETRGKVVSGKKVDKNLFDSFDKILEQFKEV